jgi:hypothetical protein
MQKQTMEGNILPKAKQRFQVDNLGETSMQITKRGELDVEVGVIKLADETQVPGGRVRAGSFETEFQFGDPAVANQFWKWFKMAIDSGSGKGINPTYKRNATIMYLRLFDGNSDTYNSGTELPPVVVQVEGCWCSKMTFPEYDMKADDGDEGWLVSKATINFDNVRPISGLGSPNPATEQG